MAAFKFKLEALLKFRAQQEDEAERRLARRLKQIGELERQLAALDKEVDELAAALRREAGRGVLPAPVYLMYKRRQDHLNQDRLRGRQLLKLTRVEEEKDRRNLLEANINHRLISRLKERRLRAFEQEREKNERDLLEELAGLSSERQKLHL